MYCTLFYKIKKPQKYNTRNSSQIQQEKRRKREINTPNTNTIPLTHFIGLGQTLQ
jgi:hypothetical protein